MTSVDTDTRPGTVTNTFLHRPKDFHLPLSLSTFVSGRTVSVSTPGEGPRIRDYLTCTSGVWAVY